MHDWLRVAKDLMAAQVGSRRAGRVESVVVTSLRGGLRTHRPDDVVGEEPMEIRLGGPGQAPAPVGVTMRTPGNDFELAVGFLLAEGLIDDQHQVLSVRYCDLAPGDPAALQHRQRRQRRWVRSRAPPTDIDRHGKLRDLRHGHP